MRHGRSVAPDREGTDTGLETRGRFNAPDNRQPRLRRRRRRRIRWSRPLADDIAVERARIGSAFDVLRRASEGQIIQHYAVKLAALALCLRPQEVEAAALQLRQERDAAVAAQRAVWQAAKRDALLRCVRAASRAVRMLTDDTDPQAVPSTRRKARAASRPMFARKRRYFVNLPPRLI